MLKSVQSGKFDPAITYGGPPTSGMHALLLTQETMLLVARRPVSISDNRLPKFIRLDWRAQFNAEVARIES